MAMFDSYVKNYQRAYHGISTQIAIENGKNYGESMDFRVIEWDINGMYMDVPSGNHQQKLPVKSLPSRNDVSLSRNSIVIFHRFLYVYQRVTVAMRKIWLENKKNQGNP